MEPTTCVPRPPHSMPQPTAAADPLLLPPGVRVRSQGLRVPRGCDGGEFRRDGLAQDDRAGFAQSLHAGGVEPRAVAVEQRRTHAGDHVRGIDHVLHADWHAVDRRKWRVGPPAFRRGFGCGTGRRASITVKAPTAASRWSIFGQAFLQHLHRRVGATGEERGAADIGTTPGCLAHETSSLQEPKPVKPIGLVQLRSASVISAGIIIRR